MLIQAQKNFTLQFAGIRKMQQSEYVLGRVRPILHFFLKKESSTLTSHRAT